MSWKSRRHTVHECSKAYAIVAMPVIYTARSVYTWFLGKNYVIVVSIYTTTKVEPDSVLVTSMRTGKASLICST